MPAIQTDMVHAADTAPTRPSVDFSLVSGGPLFQLWRRMRLSSDALAFSRRRVLATVLFAWLPLLLLAAAEGRAWGDGVALTFLKDIETNVRLLIAVPLLILAEVKVHAELPRVVRCFLDRDLIAEDERPRFDAAIASAMRLRNSVVAELLLIVLVYAVGILVIRRTQFAFDENTWYASVEDGRLRLTWAGWWGALVAMPIVQFLCVRWFFRFFVWGRFLWQVSRIPLKLEPAHPDCTAGLHFIALAERACRLVTLAMGVLVAGMIANKIFYAGAALLEFKVEVAGMAALLIGMILGPMLAFTPQLLDAKHRGIAEYGRLGQRYARDFDRKWVHGQHPAVEPLLGSADLQSLADLRNSFLVVKDIGIAPFDLKNAMTVAMTLLLPIAPLLLTAFSVEDILDRILTTIF